MSKFNKYIKESIWSDMQRRAEGSDKRIEDDINLLTLDDLADYIKKKYGDKIFHLNTDNVLRFTKIYVNITQYISLETRINPKNGELTSVVAEWGFGAKPTEEIINKLKDKFIVGEKGSCKLIITDKEGGTTNSTYIDVIDTFLDTDNVFVLEESIWSDMQRRAEGSDKREEDFKRLEDIENYKLDKPFVENRIFRNFADGILYLEEYENTLDDFKKYIEKISWYNTSVKQRWYDSIYPVVINNWNKGDNISKIIGDIILNDENEMSKIGFKKESGKTIEDTLNDWWNSLDDDEKNEIAVKEFYESAEERFMETHLDDEEFTGDDIDVEYEWSDASWIDCVKIYVKYSKVNECDGVPNGLTPADVGGMGAITFPGPNGEPGSGDIPMPTGKVYQQVAPFGVFINMKRKKKKKKFRKEDEPCSHSPNAKVYDYVDDYREYVDRTYNNIDRKK